MTTDTCQRFVARGTAPDGALMPQSQMASAGQDNMPSSPQELVRGSPRIRKRVDTGATLKQKSEAGALVGEVTQPGQKNSFSSQ